MSKKRPFNAFLFVVGASILLVAISASIFFISRSLPQEDNNPSSQKFTVGEEFNIRNTPFRVNSVKIVDSDNCVNDQFLRDVIVNVDYEPGLDNLISKLYKENGELTPDGSEPGNQADGLHFKFNVSNTGLDIEDRSYYLELIDGQRVILKPYEYSQDLIQDKANYCAKGREFFENWSRDNQ